MKLEALLQKKSTFLNDLKNGKYVIDKRPNKGSKLTSDIIKKEIDRVNISFEKNRVFFGLIK